MTKRIQEGDRVEQDLKRGTVEKVYGGPSVPGLSYTKLEVQWDTEPYSETVFRDEAKKMDDE